MTTKDEVKTLWKLCFNDSDEFNRLNIYKNEDIKDEVNRVIREDGKNYLPSLQMNDLANANVAPPWLSVPLE